MEPKVQPTPKQVSEALDILEEWGKFTRQEDSKPTMETKRTES